MSILKMLTHGVTSSHFGDGEFIFSEGNTSDGNMYAVVEGCVEILKANRVLETITPGGIFGELAMLDGMSRSACAVSRGTSKVAAISANAFKEMILRHPNLALEMMRHLSIRVRTNLDLQFRLPLDRHL